MNPGARVDSHFTLQILSAQPTFIPPFCHTLLPLATCRSTQTPFPRISARRHWPKSHAAPLHLHRSGEELVQRSPYQTTFFIRATPEKSQINLLLSPALLVYGFYSPLPPSRFLFPLHPNPDPDNDLNPHPHSLILTALHGVSSSATQ